MHRRSNRQTQQDFADAGGTSDTLDHLRESMGANAADSTLRRLFLAATRSGVDLDDMCAMVKSAAKLACAREPFSKLYKNMLAEAEREAG